ncbi:lysophospholipase [Aetokthonos hydrillicola Thurmond2011]|jgi:alpha-beta hydrolase superfamily lysophospholipase|uniref:Monoacylglycerol lipase n=1 Tax=Aetokthonos hydrillicola Thurmond2011 TaxID=2712845 RepID=A0AAP5I323_9CYAN|nr:alpha/beta hydrolase [Aetokthonos hydrillicola]MBO3458335.1 alpha/beta hydrolase [Aetokthonos hydrillicola CCALA 1050]MBW4585899.1 lysophospholipase [Aetokthonos hydrillicola CCALA 1050]MDR9893876.1 lysophospholipase [Aetokthonos hydrillicola Thurmond2011]
MEHREGSLKGVRGLDLYYQSWHPFGKPDAIVVILHGLGSHSGLFSNVFKHLVRAGYAVYGLDLRGHGRSQGQRGHITSWSEFREDLRAFLKLIEAQEHRCPRFLLGHSLGGLIILDYVLRVPTGIQGVITMAPPLGKIGISPVQLTLGRTLSQVMPRFALNTSFARSRVSREESVLATLRQDRYMHSRGSARLATEFLDTVAWIQSHANDLQVPILILHGEADQVALPEGSRIFFEKIGFPDKERYEYSESCHALHHDLNYQEILADIEDWLERHIKGGTVLPFRQRTVLDEYMLG